MLHNEQLTKEQIDLYLKKFAKEQRKITKNVDIDIVIIGGGAIVLNYNFRGMTQDLDIIKPNKLLNIKDAVNKVADEFDLPSNWMNDDFITTKSYSPNLRNYATYYRTFSNYIHFYTIKDEYLIAMKLVSDRNYKFDMSDIVGIIKENENISYENIKQAILNLYGKLDIVNKETLQLVETLMNMPRENLPTIYENVIKEEEKNKMNKMSEIKKSTNSYRLKNHDDFDIEY